MPKILSSWSMGTDGKLVENDLKLSYTEEDGSYTIESKHESIGVILGSDGTASKKYTIITSIPDTKRMARFRPFVNVGDILVAINDEIIVEQEFKDVIKKLESLVKSGSHRKLTFLNPSKYSIDLFIAKLKLNKQGQTDLLGFTCSPEEHLLERHYQVINSNYLQSRDLEWVNYLKSIGGVENLKPAGVFKPLKDLKQMVRKGIPVAYRAAIWPKISLSAIYRLQFPTNYYAQLLERCETELPEKVKIDIEKDVDRTFPEHSFFNPAGVGEESLRRILQAFALHHPAIGYCQSLNFLAGMMLIFMSEEESFWLLITVVEKLLPPDYYTKSMVGTYVDQFVLAHIIKKYLPNIHKALDDNQLQLPLITVQWFMCLFVNTLRPEVTLRIWDMFLNEGSKVLFRIAAALFKIHEPELMNVRDAGDLFTTLRKLGKDVVDADVLISAAYRSYQPNNPVTRSTNSGAGNSANNSQKILTQSLKAAAAAGANNGNSSSTKAKPSPLTAFRKQLFDISPRLGTQSDAGKVPQVLQGVGLAHVGPIVGERPKAARYESVADLNTYVFDLADGSLPVEFDQDMMKTAQQMSDNLLSSEMYETKASEASSPVESKESSEPASPGKTSGPVSPTSPVARPPPSPYDRPSLNSPMSPSAAELINNSTDSYDQSLFTNPDQLLTSVRDSIVASRAATIGLNTANHTLKPKRNRKFKLGEFTFTRADIAVWRSTFRPGLQERYERMERARNEYHRIKEIPRKKVGTGSDADTDTDKKNAAVEEKEGDLSKKLETIDLSAPPPMAPFNAILRRSISAQAESGKQLVVDVEAINTDYDVDHQFEQQRDSIA